MYSFNPSQVLDGLVSWIRDWFERNGKDCNAVIGLSGGKDSTIVAAFCVRALGAERVIGVSMPDGSQGENGAREIAAYLGIRYIVAPITGLTQAFRDLQGPDFHWSAQSTLNIPPRVRMAMLYAIAQSNNGRVSCNCNLSEDWIGYSTRWGDDCGDFRPISNLTVTEVRAIGRLMGLPAEWIDKIPDDGLPGSSPDEVKIGFTYETLDLYIRGLAQPDPATRARIDSMHTRNLFKLSMPESFMPDFTA